MKRPLAAYHCMLTDCEHILEYQLKGAPTGSVLRIREYFSDKPDLERRINVDPGTDRRILTELARCGSCSPGNHSTVMELPEQKRAISASAPVAVSFMRHRNRIFAELVYYLYPQTPEVMTVGIDWIQDGQCVGQSTHSIHASEPTALELMLICARHFVFPASLAEILRDADFLETSPVKEKTFIAVNRQYAQA